MDCTSTSDFRYSVFGLLLHSNVPLHGVVPVDSLTNHTDIELLLGASPYRTMGLLPEDEKQIYRSSYSLPSGEPILRVWDVAAGAFLRVDYTGGPQFWLDRKREVLWADWPETSSLEDTCSYLLGPVLGYLLRLRGVTCLHASAVAFDNSCVAFVGTAGSGKSTTAAAFARQGHGVISDDVVALVEQEGAFRVRPAYPHLSLWPDSVNALFGSSEALPRFIPEWEKRRLALGDQGTRFENRLLRLGAIYLLGERCADGNPRVEGVRPQSALLSLVAETYANKILDRGMRAREFEVLGRLVTSVPVRRVQPHPDPARLAQLCQAIQEDFDSLDRPLLP